MSPFSVGNTHGMWLKAFHSFSHRVGRCGHFIQEDAPEIVIPELMDFIADHLPSDVKMNPRIISLVFRAICIWAPVPRVLWPDPIGLAEGLGVAFLDSGSANGVRGCQWVRRSHFWRGLLFACDAKDYCRVLASMVAMGNFASALAPDFTTLAGCVSWGGGDFCCANIPLATNNRRKYGGLEARRADAIAHHGWLHIAFLLEAAWHNPG